MTEWRRRFQDPSLVPSCADQSVLNVSLVLTCTVGTTVRSACGASLRSTWIPEKCRDRRQASATRGFFGPLIFIHENWKVIIASSSSAELLLSTRHGHDHPHQW